MALCLLGMAQAPDAVCVAHDAFELVVGLQGISAGFHEREDTLPDLFVQPGIGQARADFRQQLGFLERCCAGAGHHVLGQHVEPAGPEFLAIALTLVDRLLRGRRLEEFEPVARHEQGATGLIEPVVGPPDALQQARRSLRCPHLHHKIDIAPVDPQIEAGGRHQCAQLAARHRSLHLSPRFLAQRTVMNADR